MPNQTGIKKLKNGRYKARYFAGFDSKGKRQYPARTFDTQSEASKWRTTQINAKNSGKHYESHGLTVEKFLDQWLAMKAQVLRTNSLEMYRQTLDSYVKPEVGGIKLTRLRPSHIEAMVTRLLGRLSASTVATARLLLNGSLKKAVRLGLIPFNPVENTDGPKRAKPKRYPLTVEESMRLVDACVHSRFGLFFVFALHTGLRPEEGIGLQWCNLELADRGIVRVSRVIHRTRGGGWQWQEPKTKNSNRRVVFPGWLATMLSEHRKKQLERKLKAGPRWTDNDLVFCTKYGAPILHCALTEEFKSVLAAAGLPKSVRQYDLRHSFVTTSLIAGVDSKTVSQEAGHASVAFTLDHYGSVLEEMHVQPATSVRGYSKAAREVNEGEDARFMRAKMKNNAILLRNNESSQDRAFVLFLQSMVFRTDFGSTKKVTLADAARRVKNPLVSDDGNALINTSLQEADGENLLRVLRALWFILFLSKFNTKNV